MMGDLGTGTGKILTRDELAKEIADLCDCVLYEDKIKGGMEAINLVLAWRMAMNK